MPLDRHFIEDFLERNSVDIQGACLEVLDRRYTMRFGGEAVISTDVLDIDRKNETATIIDDLRDARSIASDTYDCIVLTQVLQFIDEPAAAIAECHRILKQNGVLLITLPSISRADCASGNERDYWRFTQAGARHLLSKHFEDLSIETYGNARTGMYFYAGFAQEDTPAKLLRINDPDFPTIISVRAKKT